MSDLTSNNQAERLTCEALHGKSTAAISDPRPSITKAQFERLVQEAVAEYHATPRPGLGDAGDPYRRFQSKAVVERLHRHMIDSLSYFGCPGDDT